MSLLQVVVLLRNGNIIIRFIKEIQDFCVSNDYTDLLTSNYHCLRNANPLPLNHTHGRPSATRALYTIWSISLISSALFNNTSSFSLLNGISIVLCIPPDQEPQTHQHNCQISLLNDSRGLTWRRWKMIDSKMAEMIESIPKKVAHFAAMIEFGFGFGCSDDRW